MVKIFKITENKLRGIIKEAIEETLKNMTLPKYLYHKSNPLDRKSILEKGLLPSVGDSYSAHWDDRTNLQPLIFLYNHDEISDGEYDSTYNDDIFRIDTNALNPQFLTNDPDSSMTGCYAYGAPIPNTALKIIYKGNGKDIWASDKYSFENHKHIYNINEQQIDLNIVERNYDGDIYFVAMINGQEVGNLLVQKHNSIETLEDEISDTDSYKTAQMVTRYLDYFKPIYELADIEVDPQYRNLGISKQLLQYALNKFQGSQFYLRACPTAGVSRKILASSLERFGFKEITTTSSNGVFMVKR